MQASGKNCWNSDFSHIYVERDILDHPNSRRILARFPHARVVDIGHYKDIFCRAGQAPRAQKHCVALLLAKRRDRFLYPGAPVCPDFGNAHFFYTSSVMNCLYDCAYCYLQGMYESANPVVFVNLEDTFAEVDRLLTQFPVYLCISYDTDLLALESVTGFVHAWGEFARCRPQLTLELRTKSANARFLPDPLPAGNFIPAWTLSPAQIAARFEAGAPSLDVRLAAIRQAVRAGWAIRLCFDPLLDVKGWQALYGDMMEQVFAAVPPEAVRDVSIGVFRMARGYLKNLQHQRPESELSFYPYACENGVCTYPPARREELLSFVSGQAARFISRDRIFVGE